MSIALIRNLAGGGGESPVEYPINLLTYLTWDTSPTTTKLVRDGSSIEYWTSLNTTPKLKSNAIIKGNLCNYSWSSNVHEEIQISEDNINWTTVMQNSNTAGELITASLSTYSSKKLYVRFKVTNTSPGSGSYNAYVTPIYPASTGIFQID